MMTFLLRDTAKIHLGKIEIMQGGGGGGECSLRKSTFKSPVITTLDE
jgi:hypothetical protein